ncbi:LysR substrate-binding domain-containing protein [Microvirga sp. M2]|uniref:LysR substrate-binding domain-containing protein n=1 Tax=Microvirga sp. M2 TaxID=3073270 RepID=UPI0039C30658
MLRPVKKIPQIQRNTALPPLEMAALQMDLALLSLVVEAGSFSKASLISGMTKSRISRRINQLETQLGVRLVDRSSRRFNPTPIGVELARHGDVIRNESDAALQLAQDTLAEPRGRLRVACPGALATLVVGSFCVDFARSYPHVTITVDAIDGARFPTNDGYDIILLITRNALPSSEMIARRLVDIGYEIVASPEWIEDCGPISSVKDLAGRSAIGWWNEGVQAKWRLTTPQNTEIELPVVARLLTNNKLIAREAAVQGLGMACLPTRLTNSLKQRGLLQVVLPGCKPRDVTVYALYRNKRSLLFAGRMFLDELTQRLKVWIETDDEFRTLAER